MLNSTKGPIAQTKGILRSLWMPLDASRYYLAHSQTVGNARLRPMSEELRLETLHPLMAFCAPVDPSQQK